MSDYSHLQLGRSGLRHDSRRRLAAHKMLEALPAPPEAVDNTNGVTAWGMMRNDQLGDCTIAGVGHCQQVATLNTGSETTPSDDLIEAGYEKYCGYVPGNDSTDQGGVELDILAGIKRDGFAGMKLLGFVSPDPTNINHVKKAIAYFGSVYVGAELPLSAQNSGVWDVVSGTNGVAGGWGGHCMVSPKYDATLAPFITWGTNQPATWAWWQKYVDECHVLLWDCWLKKFPASTQDKVLALLEDVD